MRESQAGFLEYNSLLKSNSAAPAPCQGFRLPLPRPGVVDMLAMANFRPQVNRVTGDSEGRRTRKRSRLM